LYWALVVTNLVIPQALWSARVRANTLAIFAIALAVNIGMWLERFIIVVTSLHRDFLPSSWAMYYPTIWDWSTFAGTIGLFVMLFFLFVRVLPMISIFEMKQILEKPEAGQE
jgi:molybdopterin-containing oxidoreductase family membrane subunit